MIGLAAVATGCASVKVDLAQVAAGPQPVIIRVLCPNATTVSFYVIPQPVPVRRGLDSVLWALVGHGTTATIEPKVQGQWPFAAPPHTATPGAPASSGTADAEARPGSYAYKVTAQCQVPNGGPVITVTIDPDVIITE
jgi:hypothetical protein